MSPSAPTLRLTNCYGIRICIYDSFVALRNCGATPNRTKYQFLQNVALTLFNKVHLEVRASVWFVPSGLP